MRKLLIVEDDAGLQSQYRWCFDKYALIFASQREDALAKFKEHAPAVVLLDLGLPPHPENEVEGLRALEAIVSKSPQTKVVVVTGNDDRKNAVSAIALGAYDFYQKPIEPDVLGLIVERAFHLYDLEQEIKRLDRSYHSPLQNVVACSPEMLKVCKTIERVAPADVSVLLLGESGTGKEILANALHTLSSRGKARFVAINCAAIPENLLESELFGYEKGAFTGAAKQTKGKIELAHGGTLFLDEIGEMPMSLQAKLLRFLQERVIERVGGREEIPVDVRVISATNRDIAALISSGEFREDLYYRLSEISVVIPPVRERSGDARLLARFFLEKYAAEMGRKLRGFSPEALAAIEQYPWPGNVREMENKIKRAVIMADDSLVKAEDLELPLADPDRAPQQFNLRDVREKAEFTAINTVLSITHGNVSKAAEMLGVSRPTMYDLMERHGLK